MSTTERISLMEAIEQRHSVRQYKESPLPAAVIAELADAVFACNEESGLHIQLVTNEPDAFSGMRGNLFILRCINLLNFVVAIFKRICH